MSQVASSTVPSGSGLSVREGINAVLGALMSQNSGPSAPANPIPFMVWGDTSTNKVMLRNASNTAWVTLSEHLGLGVLAGLNVAPVSGGGTGATNPDQARTNLSAPLWPHDGNFVVIATAATGVFTLPSGGAWMWFCTSDTADTVWGSHGGVNAGGYTINVGASNRFLRGFAWRISN